MLLHSGILALLLGSGIVLLMMLYACVVGLRILMKWDYQSSSEEQLALERKTYLVSTLINYAFGFVVLSGFLYIYTVDDIHKLFVGAMCATGSLNANPVGWHVLWTKILSFFLAAVWLAVNYFDQRAEDFPLVKVKYIFLLLITPLIGIDLYFQGLYFLGLEPEIITSCCGSLFGDKGPAVTSGLAGLPVKPMMWVFYLFTVGYLVAGGLCFFKEHGMLRYLISMLALAFFFVAIASVVSFISLYIYELPTHHCPFDILQKEYRFIGYPMYIALFGGVLFGLLPGLFQRLKAIATLQQDIQRAEKKWVALSVLFVLSFVIISSWPILFGNLILKGYY